MSPLARSMRLRSPYGMGVLGGHATPSLRGGGATADSQPCAYQSRLFGRNSARLSDITNDKSR